MTKERPGNPDPSESEPEEGPAATSKAADSPAAEPSDAAGTPAGEVREDAGGGTDGDARPAAETDGAGEEADPADTGAPLASAPGDEGDAAAQETPGGRRPRTAAIIASVAAAVLLVGGGGAWLAAGAGAGDRPAGGEGAPPPLALDGGPGSGSAGIAVGEPDPNGGVRYVVKGDLPQGPRSAPVRLAEGKAGEDAVARLAEALGIEGAPVADGDGWRAGEREGGPVLRVNGIGWSYSRYAAGTDNCRKVTVCSQDPVAPAHDPVGAAEAERVARPVLKALGQDEAKIDASQVMGGRRVVNADPEVAGLPTYGWTTGLTVDEKGDLVGGHGMLARFTEGDTYPVLSAAGTVRLMNGEPASGGREGIGGCASPVPLKDRLEQPCGASTGSPAAPEGGSVTVEKAVFGLAAHSVDGRPALVPSWLFEMRGSTARGAFTVAHPAVDPKYLASPGDKAPEKGGVRVEGYRAEGRKLTVRFVGGVCAEYRVSARESGDRVTVTVTKKSRPGNCIALGKEYARTVSLDAPLADREVVDAGGGRVPEAEHSLLSH